MAEGTREVKFPKLRKFALQNPNAPLGEPQPLEYTNYETTPPMTYRIAMGDDHQWRWEILQCGWTIRSCPKDVGYSNDRDAYCALRDALCASA